MSKKDIQQEPASYEAAYEEAQKLIAALENSNTTLKELGEYTLRIEYLLNYCEGQLLQLQKPNK